VAAFPVHPLRNSLGLIITAAITGFEAQKQRINSKIAELRRLLNHRDGQASTEAPRVKRKMSAAFRRRIALAQKKRWAAIKGRSAA
jgi:hypothetical protein